MPVMSLTSFFNGVSTAYFAMNACRLLSQRGRTRLRVLLGAIFAYWALATAKDLVSLMPGSYTPALLDLIQMADGWSAVTLACLLFELTMPGWVTRRRVAMLALPFMAFTAAYAAWPSHAMATAYLAFLAFFGATALRIGYAKAEVYTAYLYRNYSSIERMDISWLRKIYVAGFAYMLFWVVITVVRHPVLDSMIYLAGIAFWQLVLHYCEDLQPVVPEPDDADVAAAASTDLRDYPFAGLLESVVEGEALYLDPKLSLAQLAKRLGTNRTYISQYFNNVKNTTFYDYVNALRINKKSLPMMREHPEYAFDYVARQSGFNSLSTFHRAFRKYTGTTPGGFMGDDAATQDACGECARPDGMG